ncbi:putative triacylglycerol lipase [Helianthus annuus]|nr:putative triacylglycerol lipase [Helianthus annuus]
MAIKLRARKRVLLVIYVAVLSVLTTSTNGAPIFIFGDSTMDVGTNNHLEDCKARADHQYYGIDYQGSQATGRFSNGFSTADTIGK